MVASSGPPAADEVLEWVERMAKYYADQDGLPLIAGRILGWLMVCEPAEQSAGQIAEAIGASRASLSTNLRLLSSIGFLAQATRPGGRTVYYRVDDGAWGRVVQRQVASLTSLGGILRDGMHLVEGPPERSARIRNAHAVFAWLEKVFADAAGAVRGRPGDEGRPVSGRSASTQTAFGPMVIAAVERYTPAAQRLIDDELAVRLLPPGMRKTGLDFAPP
ncbi:GbsR/MarR family transcriptional regulator [Pseudonocardia bannensis]|uniref:GbsR/MarR family transcriptional regulator n=1 Tax=Pseudonocardia bannensis TaxID=630973 RepID=UPI001B7D0EC7|nr:hypothetical protein [Pseudonocardia bannensis]